MNFNSAVFIFYFLPVFLLVFHLSPPKFRIPILLGASLIFYGSSGLVPLAALMFTIFWGYSAALFVRRFDNRKLYGFAALSVPFLILLLFKYLGFGLSIFNISGENSNVISFFLTYTLPAGISFYTFQIATYSLDTGSNRIEPEKDFVKFSTYVSFFPQLIAGPIIHYQEIKDQLERIKTTRHLDIDVVNGIKFFSFGLFYKIILADIPHTMKELYQGDGGGLAALFSIAAYSFTIYFDFWGYSLMAIGIAKLFGISLPRNFLEPYKSPNPREFWRRWHVTLSRWLRDYVYLPMGGNEKYYANIVIVFVICGIWHGAGWNFIVWGAYHAVLVLIYHTTRSIWDRLPYVLGVALTFVLVSFGWPLFYLTLGEFGGLLETIATAPFILASSPYGIANWLYLAFVAVWTFGFNEEKYLFSETSNRYMNSPVFHSVLFFVSLMFLSYGKTFIYFQF